MSELICLDNTGKVVALNYFIPVQVSGGLHEKLAVDWLTSSKSLAIRTMRKIGIILKPGS